MNEPPEPLAGLIRDHRRFEAMIAETRQYLAAALAAPASTTLFDAALNAVSALQRLLNRDIERHIAKEETILFPLLRSQLADFVDDMIAEHDSIKAQRARVGEALASLDDDHALVREEAAAMRDGAARARIQGGAQALMPVQTVVERLDWLLQGHFTGEEDGLFLPAEDLLTAATLSELARQMATLDAEPAG